MPYIPGDEKRARDAAAARARYHQRAASAPPSKRAREFPEEDEDDAQDAADALHSLRLAGAQLGAHARDTYDTKHNSNAHLSPPRTPPLFLQLHRKMPWLQRRYFWLQRRHSVLVRNARA